MESEANIKKTQKESQTRDVLDTNAVLMENKNSNTAQEKNQYKKDKLDYFPFVSGQIIEDHQKSLNTQLRADMKSYITSKANAEGQRKRTIGMEAHSVSSNYLQKPYANFAGGLNASPSQVSGYSDAGSRLTRSIAPTVSSLKNISDSKYIKPSENFRVIQENDPVRQKVFLEAMQRHREQKNRELAIDQLVDKQAFDRANNRQNDDGKKAAAAKANADAMREELMKQITENAQSAAVRH